MVRDAPSGIAVAAPILNEAPYLVEWIEFHRLVGVDHFVIYDNGSTDDCVDVLRPFIQAGIVSLVPWRPFGPLDTQTAAYAHATTNFGSKFRWLAMIDVDEFLFPVNADTLVPVLARYDAYAALRVSRVEFGPGGHKTKPEGLVTENYLQASTSVDYRKVKTIARPPAIVRPFAHLTEVDGEEIQMELPVAGGTPGLRINHYFSRSEAEFEAKLRRGWRRGGSSKIRKKLDVLAEITRDTVRDEEILRFSRRLPHP